MTNLIAFGFLIKPHGINGNISCRFFNKTSKIIIKGSKLYLNNSINNFLIVKSINYQSNKILIRFIDINTRNEIEKLRDVKFYINKKILPDLFDKENYFVDFIGSTLYNQNKIEMGMVIDIIHIKNNDVLVFNGSEGEKMVPFAKELILLFDKNKLVMTIHDGMV